MKIYDGSNVELIASNMEEALNLASCPNALFFTKDKKASEQDNLVIDGHASKISLTDSEPLYSPSDISTETLSYTRNFTSDAYWDNEE